MLRKVLGVMMAVLALALVAGAASANRSIVFRTASLARITALGELQITERRGGGAFDVQCDITRTLRLNERIVKMAGATVGQVTRLDTRNCIGGNFELLDETLPWTISYSQFIGTLPEITDIDVQIRGVKFLVEDPLGIARCLYSGNLSATFDSTVVRDLTLEARTDIPLIGQLRRGIMECPREAKIVGTAAVSGEIRVALG
jgi:hypothetical protein